MKTISFATSNVEKLMLAQTVCEPLGVTLKQVKLDIDEIQAEDPRVVVADKARRAFELLGEPVVVSDDSWRIPALKGFPGPYMKSINYWFTPDDFLRLMQGVEDRTVVIEQYVAFTDGRKTKIFMNEVPGKFSHEARGHNPRSPNMLVTELDIDNGKTIAEVFEIGQDAVNERYKNRKDAWHDFVEWYRQHNR